jgi:hypothetical protein
MFGPYSSDNIEDCLGALPSGSRAPWSGSLAGGLLRDSEDQPNQPEFSAAWVPFPVLSAVLGAAICRSTPLYAGR